MYRWDLINYLIQKYKYTRYLEIGYYKGWSFDKVNCDYKVAVDPNPCKTEEQIKAPYRSIIDDPSGVIRKEPSNEFFEDFVGEYFDIIFIDGLHEAAQVHQDILHAVEILKEGGIIILHDCNPPKEEHTKLGGLDGAWTGDCWKALVQYRKDNPSDYAFTIDTDWGLGVIKPGVILDSNMKKEDWENVPDYMPWIYFENNRQDLLNLKTIKEAYDIL